MNPWLEEALREGGELAGELVHFYLAPPFGPPVCGVEDWKVCTTSQAAVSCPLCQQRLVEAIKAKSLT